MRILVFFTLTENVVWDQKHPQHRVSEICDILIKHYATKKITL